MSSRLTIFTPTYNRAYTLSRLYESVKQQTCKNFIWLIVDDGSTDNTYELIRSWMDEKLINIKYYRQRNSGKHVAHNVGVNLCDSELFFCVDSDDWLPDYAVEFIIKFWENNYSPEIAGIVGLKAFESGEVVGSYMPKGITKSTLFDLYNKYRKKGDTALIFRTDVLKKFPFPVIDGEKFITENIVYDMIDQEYQLLVVNKVLYYCEYLNDGLTRNAFRLQKNNPRGYILYYRNRMKIAPTLSLKFKYITMYSVYNMLAGEKGWIKSSPYKFLTLISIPFAIAIKFYRYRNVK